MTFMIILDRSDFPGFTNWSTKIWSEWFVNRALSSEWHQYLPWFGFHRLHFATWEVIIKRNRQRRLSHHNILKRESKALKAYCHSLVRTFSSKLWSRWKPNQGRYWCHSLLNARLTNHSDQILVDQLVNPGKSDLSRMIMKVMLQ
jgi:hypothetical protein